MTEASDPGVSNTANLVRADADMAYEAELLHALVDGLALDALTTEAKDLRPKAILAVLRTHLAALEPRR